MQYVDQSADAVGEEGRAVILRTEGTMEVSSTGAPLNFLCVGDAKAAARGDLDASSRAGDEACEYVAAGEYVRCASRGEDAMTAGCDDVFEGAIEVGNFIERAVEGDFHRRGEFDQSAGACCMHCAVRVQHADDDAGRSKALRVLKLGEDGGEVGCGVDKSIGVRTQKYVDRKPAASNGLFGKFMAGRKTTYIEHGAELDAVRAACLGQQAGSKGFGAQFEDDRLAHG